MSGEKQRITVQRSGFGASAERWRPCMKDRVEQQGKGRGLQQCRLRQEERSLDEILCLGDNGREIVLGSTERKIGLMARRVKQEGQ